PRACSRRLRRPRPDLLSTFRQMGRRIFLASAPLRPARGRRHFLRPSRRPFQRACRLHARQRRGVPRHSPPDRPQANENALHRRRRGQAPHLPRPLRRVQPALRPRHPVRPQDRRQHRRDPDEPSPAGEVGMSYESLPDGELAAVVTYLEMLAPPDHSVPPSPLSLKRVEVPEPEHYRGLFRRVGAPWLWFSRLTLDDAHLAEIIQHPKVELYSVLDDGGNQVGMLELDFREPHECELSFIGLVPELAGQGHGRWLLAEALRLAWPEGVDRVHVHTCSLDHPAAL